MERNHDNAGLEHSENNMNSGFPAQPIEQQGLVDAILDVN